MWRRAQIEQLEDRRLLAWGDGGQLLDLESSAPGDSMPLELAAEATTTSLSLSATSIRYGQTVELAASVSAGPFPGAGLVRFLDGQDLLGQRPLDGQGQARLAVSTLEVGKHAITVEYLGAAGLAPSTSPASELIVRRGVSRTWLAFSSKRLPVGQPLTLTAWARGAHKELLGGTIVFKEGRKVLGQSQVIAGAASLTVSGLKPGKHTITATFTGDRRYTGSRSAPATHTTTPATLVDLMALYTADAVMQMGGEQFVHEQIAQAVRDTNRALLNSKVAVSIRLVHETQTSYVESGQLEIDLDRLADPRDGYMDEVDSLRDRYGADLVTLFAGTGDVGGMAYTLQYPQLPNNDELGFSVLLIQQAAAPTYTLAHELGHNFGAVHDRENADFRGAYSYSYGYRWVAGRRQYRDIMSYEPGTLIPYFANPNVRYKGVRTGAAGYSDVARTIAQTAPIVAEYRQQRVAGMVIHRVT